MSVLRRLRLFSCLLISTAPVGLGCKLFSGLAPAIELSLTNLTHIDTTPVEFDFTITNISSAAVNLPACDHRVGPEFTLERRGGLRDHIGGVCLAIFSTERVPLAAGARLTGHGSVQRFADTRYTPFLSYTVQPFTGPPETATASPFRVP